MKRGDIVTVAVQGDFGKPRPALVVQSDLFADHATVTLLPVSSTIVDSPLLRMTVEPTPANGLRLRSQIMIDKATTVLRAKVGHVVGRLDATGMVEVERLLALFLGLAR